MTFYLVTMVLWSCPGGFLGGYTPHKIKPYICEEGSAGAIFDRRSDAESAVDKAGQNAKPRLFKYVGLRREELPVTFKPRS